MEIKRLTDGINLQQAETFSEAKEAISESTPSIADFPDSIQAESGSLFDSLTSAGQPIANLVVPELANSGIQDLAQKLNDLKIEKQGLQKQIINLMDQMMTLETLYAEHPTAELADKMATLEQQIQSLKNDLAQVESQIKQILQEIQNLQQQEDVEKAEIERRQELEQKIVETVDKAADSYSQILSDISKLGN